MPFLILIFYPRRRKREKFHVTYFFFLIWRSCCWELLQWAIALCIEFSVSEYQLPISSNDWCKPSWSTWKEDELQQRTWRIRSQDNFITNKFIRTYMWPLAWQPCRNNQFILNKDLEVRALLEACVCRYRNFCKWHNP